MTTHRPCFIISLALVGVLLLSACQPQPTPQPTSALSLTATLKEIAGTVTIKQPGASDFSTASIGMELQPNGSIQTGDNSRARLDLSTGTIIRVAPSSLFTLTSNQPSKGSLSTQLNLNAGLIFIILNGGNTNVNTPSGVATVRGSYLSVYVDPTTQTVVVTCLEGHCGASNSAGSVDFGTGQETTLFSCTAGVCTVPNVGPMTPQEFQDWLDNNPDLQQQIPGLFATMTALVSTQASTTEPQATETPAATSAPTSAICLNIISPNTDSNFDPTGPVTFAWNGRSDASKYRLTIHYPNGATASFYTDSTSIIRYMESMPAAGSYTWDVTAFDNSGNAICTTGESAFTKSEYDTPVPRHPNPQPMESTNPPL